MWHHLLGKSTRDNAPGDCSPELKKCVSGSDSHTQNHERCQGRLAPNSGSPETPTNKTLDRFKVITQVREDHVEFMYCFCFSLEKPEKNNAV